MKAFILFAVAALAGCATNPAAIRATPTDHKPYMVYDCATLTERVAATDQELRRYVASQGNARVGDAIMWPIPISRIFGKNQRNVEAISRLGGQLDALRKAQTLKCENAAMPTA
jgi:hypothetical protein